MTKEGVRSILRVSRQGLAGQAGPLQLRFLPESDLVKIWISEVMINELMRDSMILTSRPRLADDTGY